MRDALLCVLNYERTGRGLPALVAEPRLQAAAQKHSDDMAARNYFDHYSPEGRDPRDRLDSEGYPWDTYGENIAGGYTNARDVMKGWLSSPGHCGNVLSPAFVDIGIGLSAESPPLWTQNFGRQQGAPVPSTYEAPRDSCPQTLLRDYGIDPAICEQATEKLRQAQKRLKKLRKRDADTAAIARARNRVKEAKEAVRETCN